MLELAESVFDTVGLRVVGYNILYAVARVVHEITYGLVLVYTSVVHEEQVAPLLSLLSLLSLISLLSLLSL